MTVKDLPHTHPARRAAWLDVARGGAIIAMIIYHFAFDLTLLRFVDWPVASDPLWRTFAAAIASTFLFSVGVSLVYAHHKGVRWRPFVRRLAIIAASAAAVSIATLIVFPAAPILFGILHAIAVFSVLALPFVFAPIWLTGVAVIALFAAQTLAHPTFNAPWAYPLGLATIPPVTFDYEPIVPWLAVTLIGVAVGRLTIDRMGSTWHGGFLGVLGRRSLIIYLLHQPVMFGSLLGLAQLLNR